MPVPRVCIGLPVFNGAPYLAEALDSLLAQTFTDFEIIISDNASTDRTAAIAASYLARDRRVRYVRNCFNIGLARNFNLVFGLARSPYFKWATADDVCLPEFLARCVDELDQHPSVVLTYPRTQFIGPDGTPLAVDDPGWDLRCDDAAQRLRFVLEAEHWVNSLLGLIRRDALARTRGMPLYPGGDYRVLAKLSLLGKFHEIPERLYQRRLHANASSQHSQGGAIPDPAWLVRYWRGSKSQLALPGWQRVLDELSIILGSGLPARARASLVAHLARRINWRRRDLFQEFGRAVFEWVSCLRPTKPNLAEYH